MFLRSIFAAWLVIFALPQADPPAPQVRVWVHAMAKNGLDAEIAQHTVEMLERLPNVTVVDQFPYHYELQIVGLKESDNVALGVAALRIFDNSKIADEFVRYQTLTGCMRTFSSRLLLVNMITCKRCAVRS